VSLQRYLDVRELPYYPTQYERDLRSVLSDRGSISVVSFVPDQPDVPYFREPARQLRKLPDQTSFVATMFWQVLADQATHSLTRHNLAAAGIRVRPPTLDGFLGSAGCHMHPVFLLLALSVDPRTHDPRDVREAVVRQGADVLPDIRACLKASWEKVAQHMSEAIAVDAIPTSLHAFVPGNDQYRLSPDRAAVATWCAAARELISAMTAEQG
jgi:hypothetical protein